MEIGFVREEQLPSVADLLHDMSVHYNGDNASSREAVEAHLLANILGPEAGVRLVAACNGSKVVGLAAISLLYPAPKERGQLFMKELYVISGERGHGVGKALMQWLARYALEKNCVRFDWTVEQDNARALSFYRKLGAMHVSEKLYFRLAGDAIASFAGSATEGGNDGG